MADNDKDVPVSEGFKSFGVQEVEDPCDDLHIAILGSGDGQFVQLDFCQPVSWWTMAPEQAIYIGNAMIEAGNLCLTVQAKISGITH